MGKGISKRGRPMRWLMRKLAHGLPPLPTTGGHALATRVAGLLLVGGALLIAVTVVLPPSAEGSDLLILGYGAVAALAGVLMLTRRRVSEPTLGLAAALGTAVITLATLEAGQGRGARGQRGALPLGLAVRLLVLRSPPRPDPARIGRNRRRDPAGRRRADALLRHHSL